MILSLIIPAYNVEKYIETCLISCANQDLPKSEYEIIVINDGSQDASLQIAELIAGKEPNIKILSQNNQGQGVARNNGLEVATGDYIWFVDSDDWIEKNCLSSIADICRRTCPDILRISGADVRNGREIKRFRYKKIGIVESGRKVMKDGIEVGPPFSIYRRGFLNDNSLRFYPFLYHEDQEFTPRAYYRADRVISEGDVYYYVRQNPTSTTRTTNPKKSFDLLRVIQCLHEFEAGTVHDCSSTFDLLISQALFTSLRQIMLCAKSKQEEFASALYNNRVLLVHVRHSQRIKQKLFGIVFSIFPRHILEIYRALARL